MPDLFSELALKWLVLHFAHGYLVQGFFSPLANRLTDEYGGSFENGARFLLETLAAVRAVWPEPLPFTAETIRTDYSQHGPWRRDSGIFCRCP